jgi:hypothetical protein
MNGNRLSHIKANIKSVLIQNFTFQIKHYHTWKLHTLLARSRYASGGSYSKPSRLRFCGFPLALSKSWKGTQFPRCTCTHAHTHASHADLHKYLISIIFCRVWDYDLFCYQFPTLKMAYWIRRNATGWLKKIQSSVLNAVGCNMNINFASHTFCKQ